MAALGGGRCPGGNLSGGGGFQVGSLVSQREHWFTAGARHPQSAAAAERELRGGNWSAMSPSRPESFRSLNTLVVSAKTD